LITATATGAEVPVAGIGVVGQAAEAVQEARAALAVVGAASSARIGPALVSGKREGRCRAQEQAGHSPAHQRSAADPQTSADDLEQTAGENGAFLRAAHATAIVAHAMAATGRVRRWAGQGRMDRGPKGQDPVVDSKADGLHALQASRGLGKQHPAWRDAVLAPAPRVRVGPKEAMAVEAKVEAGPDGVVGAGTSR
jgi:hypothetical protein